MDKSQLYPSSALPSTAGSSSLSTRSSVVAYEALMRDPVDAVGGIDRRLNESDEQGKGREGKARERRRRMVVGLQRDGLCSDQNFRLQPTAYLRLSNR